MGVGAYLEQGAAGTIGLSMARWCGPATDCSHYGAATATATATATTVACV